MDKNIKQKLIDEKYNFSKPLDEWDPDEYEIFLNKLLNYLNLNSLEVKKTKKIGKNTILFNYITSDINDLGLLKEIIKKLHTSIIIFCKPEESLSADVIWNYKIGNTEMSNIYTYKIENDLITLINKE